MFLDYLTIATVVIYGFRLGITGATLLLLVSSICCGFGRAWSSGTATDLLLIPARCRHFFSGSQFFGLSARGEYRGRY